MYRSVNFKQEQCISFCPHETKQLHLLLFINDQTPSSFLDYNSFHNCCQGSLLKDGEKQGFDEVDKMMKHTTQEKSDDVISDGC